MTNHEKLLVDENNKYKFDFSELEYVWVMHDATKRTILSDVDFITETENEVLFIEYKNANVEGVANPDAILKK